MYTCCSWVNVLRRSLCKGLVPRVADRRYHGPWEVRPGKKSLGLGAYSCRKLWDPPLSISLGFLPWGVSTSSSLWHVFLPLPLVPSLETSLRLDPSEPQAKVNLPPFLFRCLCWVFHYSDAELTNTIFWARYIFISGSTKDNSIQLLAIKGGSTEEVMADLCLGRLVGVH